MKQLLYIWLYDGGTDRKIHAHDYVLYCASDEIIIHTYDTSFFSFSYLNRFKDVIIHWKTDTGRRVEVSLRDCLNNKCPLFDREIRPAHNMQKLFWGYLYKLDDANIERLTQYV